MLLDPAPGRPFDAKQNQKPRLPLHGKFIARVLAGILVVLFPLAYASPPDPTWIAGIYDNADYDDVVFAITSADGALDTAEAKHPVTPRSSVRLDAASETARAAFPHALDTSRAPPA